MLTIRAMSDGRGYSSRHLENRDYYAEGERVTGQWQGRAAELLELRGEVKTTDFESLCQGLDPKTGQFLRQRHSADRVASDGTTQSRGRHLYDFTISAPKSVSIMAVLGEDERLIDAHANAVAEALGELERFAAGRVRQSGANEDRETGNLAIAVYHHDTSRELDPQLHTHAVAANLTYDGREGRWKALQASGIYERRAYLTEVYRNSLARQVRLLGYDVENHRNPRGRDCGFEIRGVPDELLTRFSQRSRQRDEAIDKFVADKGRRPTDNEVAVLVRESRAGKLIEISTDELRARQRSRISREDAQTLAELRPVENQRAIPLSSAEVSLEYAKEDLFERVSVSRDYEVLTEALRHGRGQIGLEELKGILTLQESSGRLLRHGNEIATSTSLEREREMVDAVNRGIGRFEPLGGRERFLVSDRLNPEQKHAVQFVLESRDRAVNISGAAGTGKTATLQEINRGLGEAGREVIAVAPTMSAVEELKKVGFSDAVTLEGLLQNQAMHAAVHGKVLILDEAGMVSGRQMSDLLRIAEQQSARIILSGDTKQIPSVEAGDALRVLERESRLKSVSLTQVHRQAVQGYREAIQDFRRDPARGFEKLEAMGAVREVPWAERASAVAQAFTEYRAKGRNPLVVCATHDDIERVTEAIRSSMTHTGELQEGIQTERDVPLNWTAARKKDLGNLRPGQILGFHRAVRGIARNESAEVVEARSNCATVRNRLGEVKRITAKQAGSFEVYERHPIEVSAGDRLLLTANRREPGFRATNGEIVTVRSVDQQGRIRLLDGRTLPDNYRQFAHGYAVTAHRSQGKTVDSVVISGDGMSRELFYVAASRGRECAVVITGDKQLLRRSVAKSAARQSASELARKLRPGLHRGIQRGLAAARRLAAWAAKHVRPERRSVPRHEPMHELRPISSQGPRQPLQDELVKEQSHDHSIGR
jgi:conjugative relaxase-like TrwC/TraI family protein